MKIFSMPPAAARSSSQQPGAAGSRPHRQPAASMPAVVPAAASHRQRPAAGARRAPFRQFTCVFPSVSPRAPHPLTGATGGFRFPNVFKGFRCASRPAGQPMHGSSVFARFSKGFMRHGTPAGRFRRAAFSQRFQRVPARGTDPPVGRSREAPFSQRFQVFQCGTQPDRIWRCRGLPIPFR